MYSSVSIPYSSGCMCIAPVFIHFLQKSGAAIEQVDNPSKYTVS